MFERRVKVLLIFFVVALAIIVGRLFQLQVVRADYYRQRTLRALIRKPQSIPFARGRILDRTGEVLVTDRPSWDVCIDFLVIAADVGGDASAMASLVRRWKRTGRYPGATTDEAVERAFAAELKDMWDELARFPPDDHGAAVAETGANTADTNVNPSVKINANVTTESLRLRAARLYERIMTIRRIVAARRGFDSPVAEERQAHPILPAVGPDLQVTARDTFRRYPWVSVRNATARTFPRNAIPLAHVLGRVARVDAATVADDVHADDPFAKYLADEVAGVTGVEFAAERRLRGRRGRMTRERGNRRIVELIEPQNGEDVTLTLHAELQRRLYALLGEAMVDLPNAAGGSIVVLDVAGRQVLAMVSYPAYDPSRFRELYLHLRDDTRAAPLRFRAVANTYAPGSIIKPLVCLAGLMTGRITLDSRESCTGYLLPDHRDRWRCWRIEGTTRRKAHGSIDVVEALRGSCNVFMYRLGERIGVDGLCSAFDMVGLGRSTGIGLREERYGVNPTPGWLAREKNTPAHPAHARLFAIGQGEVSVTPVQAANLMATYASGRYREVTLISDDVERPEWTIPVSSEQRRAIRRGIFEVVNDRNGTAYKHAYFHRDGYALCGKTGSATAHPWPTAYRVPYVDHRGEPAEAVIPAGARGPALKRFRAEHPDATFDPADVSVQSRWPQEPPATKGTNHAHAWFAGYLQKLNTDGTPDLDQTPTLAFAVLVEFGGSGGRVAGPIGRHVAATLLDLLGPDLSVNPL